MSTPGGSVDGPTEAERAVFAELTRLLHAVRSIYFAAHWTPDRRVIDEKALWTELRDAARIEPGASTKVLGELRRSEEPFTYAHRYPDGIRYGTGGRSINGNPPLEAIPLYLHPKLDDKPTHAVGVSVLLTRVHEGRTQLLLGRRKNNSGAGLLSTPGGRLELTESILACALREFYEETGARLYDHELRVLDARKHFRFGQSYVMFYVHARAYAGEITNQIPDKSDDWAWHDIESLALDEVTEPEDILKQLWAKTLMDPMGSR